VASTYVVTTTGDATGDDGELTLREALALADADNLTADRVEFAPEVQGGTIVLRGGELTVNSDVTVDGGAGVTVDADGESRVLRVEGFGTDVVVRHLTITGGHTTADQDSGGGIRAGAHTTLTLDHATVSGNSTTGSYAGGGGIWGSSVTLTDSAVSGNATAGDGAPGGGIYGYQVTLSNSTVSGNSTAGDYSAGGGGISARYGTVTLTDSTVAGNHTAGGSAYGGGIYGYRVSLTGSTVKDNSTTGDGAPGGGISARYATLTGSTVSGNATAGDIADGGGMASSSRDAYGALTLTNSTVTGNSASGSRAEGGGIYLFRGSAQYQYAPTAAELGNSIVAGNGAAAGGTGADVSGTITASNGHNIFGSDVQGGIAGDREEVPVSLLFAGGLADNGGPTQTVALRDAPDNPAIDAADPATAPERDQRGFARVGPPTSAASRPGRGTAAAGSTGCRRWR
jgi:hypothetical protein